MTNCWSSTQIGFSISSTNVTTLLYSRGSFEVNLLFAKKSSAVSGSGFTVWTLHERLLLHIIGFYALYFWNGYNTILVWSEKSKPPHSIPQSSGFTMCTLHESLLLHTRNNENIAFCVLYIWSE